MNIVRTFKYRLRGGASGELTIADGEKTRLFSLVQNVDHSTPFIVFDSDQSQIILNLKHLLYSHFLFDAGQQDEKEKDEEYEEPVNVIFADGAELSFGVEPDEPKGKDDPEGQFADILFTAETSVEEDTLFHFVDEDGEEVFLRALDIAMMKIPLWVIREDEAEKK